MRATRVRPWMLPALIGIVANPVAAQARIDGFDDAAVWRAVPGEGVSLLIGSGPGRSGRALRLAFDFHGRGGYAVARRTLDLPLPENYEIAFWVRGAAPSNTLEFKLIDSSGANVWWWVRRNFIPSSEWTRIVIPRRQITFAWGPAGGGTLARAAAIEIAVTAGSGGRGTVWLDDLGITEREAVKPYTAKARASATGSAAGTSAGAAIDGDERSEWRLPPGSTAGAITVDFGQVRELGGLILDWPEGARPARFAIDVSADGRLWETVREAPARAARDFLQLPEIETRHLRARIWPRRGAAAGLRELSVEPLPWSASRVPMLEAVADFLPGGDMPRSLTRQQIYWTVVGASGDREEALLNEDGGVEVRAGGASLEPFLRTGGRFITWRDVEISHSLEQGDLPIPTVHWHSADVELDVTAAAPVRGAETPVVVRYRIRNLLDRTASTTLYLALRPFQVNPPWQFLGVPGGPASVGRASAGRAWLSANGAGVVRLATPPARRSAVPFAAGDVVTLMRADSFPPDTTATDADSLASAGVAFPQRLGARDSVDIYVTLPLARQGRGVAASDAARSARRYFGAAVAAWRGELDGLRLGGPPAVDTIARAIRSSLAYILINRDGPAIQPGSRSYARSWIRDGALTSTALLRLGHAAEVREFIAWYAPFQYASGRVPCCVDHRGADPVPEHDSSGEFIYLVAEYLRMSADTAFARRLWPRVQAAATFLDSLRHERLTPAYDTDSARIFRGLLPPSISHEGYSAQPMHSYWDDFFALRGFRDAAWLSATLGHRRSAARWDSVTAEFRADLVASIALVRRRRGIFHIPGAADLGDFDATSTTIALDPGEEMASLPRDALDSTFARYAAEAFRRREPGAGWDAYTPYEWRNVGAMVRLGWRDRALELTRQLMADRRPLAWNGWSEAVWREPRINRFIGDMPHTWVASDFIRSALDLFAYERTADSSLVILAGLPEAWLASDGGVAIAGLRTSRGELAYTAVLRGDSLAVHLGEGLRRGGAAVVIRAPRGSSVRSATVSGARVEPAADGEVRVTRFPADVVLRY